MFNTHDNSKRLFLKKFMRGVGYSALASIAWSAYLSESQSKELTLRPPGAISEEDFTSTCIRCGMCIEACPFNILKLSTFSDNISIGTPYFIPRKEACYLCPDMPCTNACPSGSLSLDLLKKDDVLSIFNARMGLATINTKTCLAYLGLQCTMCVRACPLADTAIFLKKERNTRTDMHAFLKPVVNPDVCTGCGMCERACPTATASIKILPLAITQADIGSHYIIGWESKDEKRIDKDTARDVTMDKTPRNKRSAIDNVNDVDGILDGIYDD
jgi:ferredoxin-type protein NapG